VGDLPQAPVNDLVVVGSSLYVATDVGVFVSSNGGGKWRSAGRNLPNVPVTDIEYRATSNSLYAATFGRGMYMLQLQ
jgi:ligand-binding sensor domain-containing protein